MPLLVHLAPHRPRWVAVRVRGGGAPAGLPLVLPPTSALLGRLTCGLAACFAAPASRASPRSGRVHRRCGACALQLLQRRYHLRACRS